MPTVLGLFQLPDLAEQAVAELSLNGFTEKDVALILFSAVREPRPRGLVGWLARGGFLGDTQDRSDGVSVMDGASVGAVFAGIGGLVWGSKSALGPITTGTLGMLLGGLVGFLCDRLIPERRRALYELGRIPGVILVEVTTPVRERAELAQQVLQRHRAKQLAVLPDGERAGLRL